MTKTIAVQTKDRTFKVVMPDLKKEMDYLDGLKEEVVNEDRTFNILWEEDVADQAAVFADLYEMKRLLTLSEAIPDSLLSHIEAIRKKKNGGFWKNSGVDMFIATNCTDYFTDYTNAWSAHVVRLDVVDEETCELSIRTRTFTY